MYLHPERVKRNFRDLSEKSGEGILAQVLRAWDSGAASLCLLMGEKGLLSPIASDDQIQ